MPYGAQRVWRQLTWEQATFWLTLPWHPHLHLQRLQKALPQRLQR